MKRTMVTGCSGFLAAHLIRELQSEGNEVSGITEETGFSSTGFSVTHCDIRNETDLNRILEAKRPDTIFHLAALSSVGKSWHAEAKTYEVNFLGTLYLLRAVARQTPSARVVLISSAEVYGSQDKILDEGSEIDIRSPYGLSKYAMEILGELHRKGHGLNILRVRSFNFTGPGQSPGFVIPDFASQIARIEKGKQEPELRVGELSVRRDFSDVRDIARYLRVLEEEGQPGEPYNLCSGTAYSIRELLDILLDISGRNIRVLRDKDLIRPVDIPVLQGSNRRIRDELNLSPRYSMIDTLRDTLDFWRQRVV